MDSLTLSNNDVHIAISGTFKRNQNAGTFEVKPGELNRENKTNLMNYLATHATTEVLVFSEDKILYRCLVTSINNSPTIHLKILSFS